MADSPLLEKTEDVLDDDQKKELKDRLTRLGEPLLYTAKQVVERSLGFTFAEGQVNIKVDMLPSWVTCKLYDWVILHLPNGDAPYDYSHERALEREIARLTRSDPVFEIVLELIWECVGPGGVTATFPEVEVDLSLIPTAAVRKLYRIVMVSKEESYLGKGGSIPQDVAYKPDM